MNEGVRWNYSRSLVEIEDISNTCSHSLYYHIVTTDSTPTTRVQLERSTIQSPSIVVQIIGSSGKLGSRKIIWRTLVRILLQSFSWRTELVGFEALSGAGARAARTELEALPAGGPVEEPNVEVQEQIVDDSADDTSHSIESRVGSRGRKLSKMYRP